MKPRNIAQYDAPHQFEPLLPADADAAPVFEKAHELMRAAAAVDAAVPLPVQEQLRPLLRAMNSYYTNRIEGEHTRPGDIERALQRDFSANEALARRQRLALAHIRTEQACEAELAARAAAGEDVRRRLYSADALRWLHRQLFEALPAADRRLADGSAVRPGELRRRQVAVGRHEAPAARALPLFIERFGEVYGSVRRGEAEIVAAAAAHHRLTWMHPFLDGNGRVARLHTHLLLTAAGVTRGMWSPLRGFARSEARYKALLQAADEHRRGDLDGRGNLTQAGLLEWIAYTLDTCIDQARFMAGLVDVRGMRERIAAALAFEEKTLRSGLREQALTPLHYLFATGVELGRAEFKALTGLGERVATELISALLREGFLASDTPYGKLRFAVPQRALRFYFPALWPEAEQDAARPGAEGPVVGRRSPGSAGHHGRRTRPI
jgi:Fic family protein